MTTRVTGYRLILPRPWVRVPVRSGPAERVRTIVEKRIGAVGSGLSPDQVGPLRRQVERRLLTQLDAARAAGGIDIYFPDSDLNGLLIGASFVVSEVSPPHADQAGDATLVLDHLIHTGGVRVRLDDTDWVRSEDVVQPRADLAEVDVPARRVTYMTSRPDDPSRWLLVAFSCVGDGDPDSDNTAAVVDLFDAIMTTWVWNVEGERFDELARAESA